MSDPNQPVTREELARALTDIADGLVDMDLRTRFRQVAAELRPREKPKQGTLWITLCDNQYASYFFPDRMPIAMATHEKLIAGPINLDLIDQPGDAELGVRLLNMTLNGWDWSFTGESFERKKGIDRDTLLRAVEDAERKMGKETTP